MRFRYKVIILNLIILSLTTGVVGFLLMQRSYRLTMDSEIKSAVTENNLVQSSVEYSLLEVINSGRYDLRVSLPDIGRSVYSGMLSGEESLFLRYAGEYLYVGGPEEEVIEDMKARAKAQAKAGKKEPEAEDPILPVGAFRYMLEMTRKAAPDTPDSLLYPADMDFRGAPETWVFYADEACSAVAEAIRQSYARDGVLDRLHMHIEPRMMHCYASAPVFRESRRDFDRQIERLREEKNV